MLLSDLDFDLDQGLFADWDDDMDMEEEAEGQLVKRPSAKRSSISQQMMKAGFHVDVLREEDLERVQVVYDRLTHDHQFKEKKRPRYKDGIPRIMRNDIRWCYSQMFMNTVNSGDFTKMQNFFHTFMIKPCKFIVDHEIDSSFGIPHRLLVNGPKLMAHYLLGVFVIFPDFILNMTDSKIISAKGWTGSKIVIEVEVKSTKLYDISLESWVPQVKYLANFKRPAKGTGGQSTEPGQEPVRIKSEPMEPGEIPRDGESEAGGFGAGASAQGGKRARMSDGSSSEQTLPNPAEVVKAAPIVDISDGTGADYVTPEDTEIRRKGYRFMNSAKKNAGAAGGEEMPLGKRKLEEVTPKEETSSSTGANASAVAAAMGMGGLPRRDSISSGGFNPEMLIKALFSSAKPEKTPQILHAKGVITIFLDGNNNMQHINLVLAQNTNPDTVT
jgi:hypothetical protein